MTKTKVVSTRNLDEINKLFDEGWDIYSTHDRFMVMKLYERDIPARMITPRGIDSPIALQSRFNNDDVPF